MKRKLKITGLALILVALVSLIVNSAASGGVGFGISIILCFFVAVFALVALFVVNLNIYTLLKKQFELKEVPVSSYKPKKKPQPEPADEAEEELC